ncbi:DNA-binding response regulator [Streptomyces sp.]|uniref:DNA-binding response regulator n=1 Tax=Streptomyces sp. TaxID=1931 RepID=UPI002F91F9D4
MTSDHIVTLRGEAELAERAGHLFGAAREEFLCAAADLVTWSAGVESAFARGYRPSARDGLAMRKVYSPAATGDPESERRLLRIADAGADVRITAVPLAREAIVIDRRIAILAGGTDRGARTYSVISSPEVVESVRSLVHATWEAATDVRAYLGRARPPALGEEARRVLDALGAGYTDEAAARHLSMSLRTYRRRVAEVMAALGAESRFQAGVRARSLGAD